MKNRIHEHVIETIWDTKVNQRYLLIYQITHASWETWPDAAIYFSSSTIYGFSKNIMTEIKDVQLSLRISTFFNIIPCIFFNMRANVRDISSFFNGGRKGVETITDWGFFWLKLYLIEILPPNNQYEQQFQVGKPISLCMRKYQEVWVETLNTVTPRRPQQLRYYLCRCTKLLLKA